MSSLPSPAPADHPTLNAPYAPEQAHRILSTVEQIVASGILGGGPRLEAILRYIVREELDGRGERIKAFSIATDVLGRAADFDPGSDSIVRVEMGRLRKALDHFAAAEGTDHPVAIQIDKGSYRPRFTDGRPPAQATKPVGRKLGTGHAMVIAGLALLGFGLGAYFVRQPPRATAPAAPGIAQAPAPEVLLLPVSNAGPAEWQSTALQLRFDLASFLAGQPWLNVHLAETPEAARRMAEAQTQTSTYALSADLVGEPDRMRLLVSLLNAPSLRVVWTRSYPITGDMAGLAEATSQVAQSVASDVAVINGVIGQAEIDRMAGRDPVTAEQQRCLLISGAFWRDYSGLLRKSAEDCLNAAIAQDGAFADGLAAAALLELDTARSDPGPAREASLARAEQLARRALAGKRSASILPETAQLAVTACRGDTGETVRLASALVALRPTSDAVLKDAANKVALAAGNWSLAESWTARAGLGTAVPIAPSAALSPVVAALLASDPARAAAIFQSVPQFDFAIGHVLRQAVGVATDDGEMQRSSAAVLARLGYANRDRRLALVRAQCWLPAIRDTVADFVNRH